MPGGTRAGESKLKRGVRARVRADCPSGDRSDQEDAGEAPRAGRAAGRANDVRNAMTEAQGRHRTEVALASYSFAPAARLARSASSAFARIC